jgi:hypothetical protein
MEPNFHLSIRRTLLKKDNVQYLLHPLYAMYGLTRIDPTRYGIRTYHFGETQGNYTVPKVKQSTTHKTWQPARLSKVPIQSWAACQRHTVSFFFPSNSSLPYQFASTPSAEKPKANTTKLVDFTLEFYNRSKVSLGVAAHTAVYLVCNQVLLIVRHHNRLHCSRRGRLFHAVKQSCCLVYIGQGEVSNKVIDLLQSFNCCYHVLCCLLPLSIQ